MQQLTKKHKKEKKQMKKKTLSGISITLAIIMAVLSFPLNVFAHKHEPNPFSKSPPDSNKETSIYAEEAEPFDLSNIKIEREDTAKRSEREKHFMLSDGSYLAVQYMEPVHFLSDDGKWEDINNTLSFEAKNGIEDFSGYSNTSGNFVLKFANSLENDMLFRISDTKEKNTISFEIVEKTRSASRCQATLSNTEESHTNSSGSILERNRQILALDNLSSQIDYNNIFDGINFQYIVTPTGVKENIIISEQQIDYSFSFIINTGELIAIQNADGSISIKTPAGESKYLIPTPYMYDSENVFSSQVDYTLTTVEEGKYQLTITADQSWINAKDRAFPVTIDPMVTTITDSFGEIDAVHVQSGANSSVNYAGSSAKYVGVSSSDTISRTYVDCTVLPYLKPYDKVISAELYCYRMIAQNATDSLIGEVHTVTGAWETATITWDTQPEYSSTILDYKEVANGADAGYISWDITDVANAWYENEECHGVVITSSDENAAGELVILQGPTGSGYEPYVLVNYRCQKGLEDKYSYTTLEDGENGRAYINNYTGTLTYVYDLYDSELNIMPIDLDLIYDSGIAERMFSGSGSELINTCHYPGMLLGDGWKLSAQESIVQTKVLEIGLYEEEYDYAYIYSDRDGTEHYLRLDDSTTETEQYVDEDDLGLTLVYNETQNRYTLTSEDGITKTFKILEERTAGSETSLNGYLISESDKHGNIITYTYDSDVPTRLIAITDPSGFTVDLEYESSGYLQKITAGSRIFTMGFTHDYGINVSGISSVTDSFGVTTTFTYANGITKIATASGSELNFSYEPSGEGSNLLYCYRVTAATYKSGAAATANTIDFTYSLAHSTTAHYYGTDCINCEDSPSIDDIYITYTFDKWGNNTLVYAENYNRDTILGSSTYGYTGTQTTDMSSPSFNITSYTDTGIIGNNILAKGNAENGAYLKYPSGNASSIITSEEKYSGNNSWRCTVTGTEGFNGVYGRSVLEIGEYTFSVYVKYTNGTNGKLRAYAGPTGGNDVYGASRPISYTVSDVNNGWQRISFDFYQPSVTSTSFYVGIEDGSGIFYADCIQLEKKTYATPTMYNLLINSGFENSYNNWTRSSPDIMVGFPALFGTYSLKLNGTMTGNVFAEQALPIGGLPNNSFILSGWAKADSVPVEKDNEEGRTFELYAKVNYTYTDSEGTVLADKKTTSIPFAWETREWQYVSGVIELPKNTDEITIVSIDSITVGASYNNNCNSAVFDNIAVVQDSAFRFTYDENGNMTSVSRDSNSSYTYTYDDNDNLTAVYDKNGALVESYTYNSDGQLTEVIDKDGNSLESYFYDTTGNLSRHTTQHGTNYYSYTSWGEQSGSASTMTVGGVQKSIAQTSVYDEISRLVTSETDSLGNTTSYDYNADRWLTLVQDANLNQTRYAYGNGKLSYEYADTDRDGALDENEANVQYSYDAFGRLSKIATATTAYVFTYNGANLLESVSVEGENTPLITYLYNDTYTLNTGVFYANALTVEYIYDTLCNVVAVKRNGVTAVEYEYNSDMQLIYEKDCMNNTEIRYHYTDGGELCLTEKNQNGVEILEYMRTGSDNSLETVTLIDGYELDYSSIYDEITEKGSYTLPDDAQIVTDTDPFGRTDKVYIKDSEGNTILTISYTYVEKTVAGVLKTSERIASVTYTGHCSYSYTYDAVGNITSVSDGTYTTTYEYDTLYQLTRENNEKEGKTWVYTYDTSGNILSKSEYTYTVGALGSAVDTVIYNYADENWGDRLTGYDGTAISYDASGNPLNWRGGMAFSWSARQLDGITKSDGTAVTFTYDRNGLRTKKTVGDDSFCYLWQNGLLTAEICNGTLAKYYFYDENGSPIAWSCDGNSYYYVKNMQGDILGFTDSEGNVIAAYEYDAWGNMLSCTGNAALAEANSLRYRGYAYDTETGFYYLQSRYYDPSVGRFLNADDTDYLGASGSILGYNLYAYCENDPVDNMDFDGFFSTKFYWWGFKLFLSKSEASNISSTLGKASNASSFVSMFVKRYVHLPNAKPIGRAIWLFAKTAKSVSKFIDKANTGKKGVEMKFIWPFILVKVSKR